MDIVSFTNWLPENMIFNLNALVFFVTLLVNGFVLGFLTIFPAKHWNDLRRKKQIMVIAGILSFLAVISGGYISYSMLLHHPPSLTAFAIISCVGLIFSIIQTVKLYYIQVATINAYELIERFERKIEIEKANKAS